MKVSKILIFSSLLVLSAILLFTLNDNNEKSLSLKAIEKMDKPSFMASFSEENGEDLEGRFDFEFARLKDPVTNKIPSNIRTKELKFAKKLPKKEDLVNSSLNKIALENWVQRGPINVGGRTRALAVDLNYNGSTNKRILAGGISGGVYLSEDNGASWRLTTSSSSLPSVTCIAQDPTNKSVWYYGTGEVIGNSTGGALQRYYGEGIFKSTNGGESWTQLTSTYQNSSLTTFDNVFDFVWNIAVHPQNGAVYVATIGTIQLSTDGGNNWGAVLDGRDNSGYLSNMTDVVIASNGDVYASLSKNGIGLTQGQYGVFRSTNGTQFTNISPPGLVADPYRIVLGTAPSDPNTLYVLVQTNQSGATAQDHQLFKYNASNNSWVDLSANLPDESGADGNASFCSQQGYDLIVKVKPDNPNVVWIGGTNLYRSTDGGQSFTRVGGYKGPAGYELYPNSHSDFHSMTFYPNNPNAMINGHDGGLSKTDNVLEQNQTWTLLNNGYVTSQFYGIAIDPQAGNDDLIIGGMQDNGSWGTESTDFNTEWFNLLSGDGGFAAIAPGANELYVSAQNGTVVRYSLQNSQWAQSLVSPNAQNFQFITPYMLDPNNPDVMYIAAGNAVWRNSSLSGIPQGNQSPTNINWTELTNSAVANIAITTLSVSKQPANRLYFGASDYQSVTKIIRVDNAQNNPTGTDITPAGITGGSYPTCIAINPNNADEIILTFSNYKVPSVWYSSNGGGSWTDVEGNLSGDEGPSIRWAVIVPGGGYFLATSTGIYSTSALNGAATTWALEAADVIGNVVVDMLALRPEDGFLVAGTHGRGVYSTKLGASSAPRPVTNVQSLTLHARPGASGSTSFVLSNEGGSTLTYNISVTGDLLAAPQLGYHQVLKRTLTNTTNINKKEKFKNLPIKSNGKLSGAKADDNNTLTKSSSILGNDILYLDDGDDGADYFLGWDDASDFYWNNDFYISGFNYSLEQINFFMRTENATSNNVYVAVYDGSNNKLVDGTLQFNTSTDGAWYSITIDPALDFNDGEMFSIILGTQSSYIQYPAGLDLDATIPGYSFYHDGENWKNINTISGFENAAFLIRTVGTVANGSNQNPVAVANVSPTQANVNDPINFDASGSYDNDGSITTYQWDFGDGSSSDQATVQHSYSQANTYTYTLTVTDDKGATNQATGQVVISQTSSSKVTANPSSGSINPGGSQTITLTLDASTVTEGHYVGQVNISTNGGNIVIPIDYTVKVEKEEGLPKDYSLSQNYPNPFNPSTTIEFAIPKSDDVSLVVYDMLGREVATLVNERLSAGNYKVQYNAAENLSSGIYIYRLKTNSYTNTKKLLLLK